MDEVEEKSRLISVGRGDFNELRNVVQRLAESQDRTEQSIKELFQAQKELTQSQGRTEQRVEALAESQKQGFQALTDPIAALGSRWGIYNEGTFRGAIRGLMSKMKDVEVREGYYGDRQVAEKNRKLSTGNRERVDRHRQFLGRASVGRTGNCLNFMACSQAGAWEPGYKLVKR